MQKYLITKDQLAEIVFTNKYPVSRDGRFLSRCIDGRYDNEKSLPALAFPGADAGEMALMLATANAYGFSIDIDKAYSALINTVGGEKNIRIHTDSHADQDTLLGGCGHIGQIRKNPAAYHLTEEGLADVVKAMEKAVDKGAGNTTLKGDHGEGAVVYVKGNHGLLPKFRLETGSREVEVAIFEYHQTLVNERHRRLAENLIAGEAVQLPDGTGSEYLYQVLSDEADVHSLETVSRLASGLPIYEVVFTEDGGFVINDLGKVEPIVPART